MRFLSTFILFVAVVVSGIAQWSPVNNGLINLTQGARVIGSSNTHLFAGAAAQLYRSNNLGDSWTAITSPIVSNVPESGYGLNNRFFVGMNASTDCIYSTSDNGATWDPVIGAPTTTVVRGFQRLGNSLYAYTSTKGVYKSVDGGVNWAPDTLGLTNLNVIDMDTINTSILAATIGGGVYISSNSGISWQQSNAGIGIGDLDATLLWRMGSNLYYISQGGGSYVSNNGGVSWTNWVKPAIMGLAALETYRKGNNLYVESRHFAGGLKDSLYVTSNEGVSWINITDNLPANLNGSGVFEFGGYVYMGFNLLSPGLGIYRRVDPTSSIYGPQDDPYAAVITTYPNPFNTELTINNTSSKTIQRITLYDQSGKRLFIAYHPTNLTLQTDWLQNGFYLLELQLDDKSILYRKVIK
jgi:hypothetical protein